LHPHRQEARRLCPNSTINWRRSNAPIVGMKTCIAGALGANTNTFRKAREP